MRPIALVDLDDTLGDLKNPMMDALNRVTGKNIHWSSWTTFNVPELYKISENDFMDILIDQKVIENVIIHESIRYI